ncbi:MAG TPA: RHS repeat-associated core domain-containing protein, partial [Longimicrobium sp.]
MNLRMRSAPPWAAAILVALALFLGARPAEAQPCDPNSMSGTEDCRAPTVLFRPAVMSWTGDTAVYALPVTIEWCDNVMLDADSRTIEFDGVDVRSSFTWRSPTNAELTRIRERDEIRQDKCATWMLSEATLSITPGSHSLEASIVDTYDIPGQYQASYTYSYTPIPPIPAPVAPPLPGASALLPTHGDVVRAAFQRVLERDPTGSEQGYWTGLVDGGMSVRQVIWYLVRSGEHGAHFQTGRPENAILASLYRHLLAREPDSGASIWLDVARSDGWGGVIEGLMNGAEYTGRFGQQSVPGRPVTAWAAGRSSLVMDPATASTAGVERGLCLTVSAGPGAAYECGDLRLAHSLPGVRTLNSGRQMALMYNSQHARPTPVLGAWAVLDTTAGALVSVEAVASIKGLGPYSGFVERARRSWTAAEWGAPGAAKRIALTFDAFTIPTGSYPSSVEVIAHYAGGVERRQTAYGELGVVNRSASPYGAGWWPAGVEQLFFPGFNYLFWVGGDGSTRLYAHTPQPGGTYEYYTYVTDAAAHPDTIHWNPANNHFERRLPSGTVVQFHNGDPNYQGLQMRTINPMGHRTEFVYNTGVAGPGGGSTATLDTVRMPGGARYTFAYAAGRLQTVTLRSGDSTRVSSLVTTTDGRVSELVDPDGKRVLLEYDDPAAPWRVTVRQDRRGSRLHFYYGGAGKLARTQLDMGLAGSDDDITFRFRPQETRGLELPVPADSAFTLLDGPQPDSVAFDWTRLRLGRFGAPTRVWDATGQVSSVENGDTRFPALATRSRGPNGQEQSAEYDARGNLVRTVSHNPLGDGRDAITQYVYGDSLRWPNRHMPTRVIGPMGETFATAYDALGRRVSEHPVSAPGRGVAYRYYDTSHPTAPGMVRAVQTAVRSDTVEYDVRGNLRATRHATYHSDVLGRDTLATVDGFTSRVRYDVMNRVIRETKLGADSVVVRNEYDDGGLRTLTFREKFPDVQDVGSLSQEWHYDNAGRAYYSRNQESITRTKFDFVGQPVEVVTPRRDTLRMVYDVAGRLLRRITPAAKYTEEDLGGFGMRMYFPRQPLDPTGPNPLQIPREVAMFTYDSVGNMLTANNRDARITRTYLPNGALATETQSFRDAAGLGFGPGHTTQHRYDLNGRRVMTRYPQALAFAAGKDSVLYTYSPGTGDLDAVHDLEGNLFSFGYDGVGRLASVTKPGGLTETYSWDEDVRLTGIRLRAASLPHGANGFAGLAVLTDTVVREEASGKVLDAISTTPNRTLETTSRYDAFGALREFRVHDASEGVTRETRTIVNDPLGNVLRELRTDYIGDTGGEGGTGMTQVKDTSIYNARGQLVRRGTTPMPHLSDLEGNYIYPMVRDIDYDLAGNQRFARGAKSLGSGEPQRTLQEWERSYYGTDDKLRFQDRRACMTQGPRITTDNTLTPPACGAWDPTQGLQPGVFQEYRYDALNRRVFVSALFAPDCGSTCHDYTEQTIWDGDQVLGEIRQASGGFQQDGTVAYTHGGGLDAPLSLVRKGLLAVGPVTIVPHSNWRGQYHAGSYTDGAVAGNSRLDLREVRWPAENAGAYLNPFRPFRRDAPWMGSLVQSSEDASGLMYRRNRYFDPKTGRFTQEDPIGLAGGLNTYGFADGDPVSYSDPYGLQPDPTCLINPGVCIALRMQKQAHIVNDVLVEGAGVIVDVLGNTLWGLATVGHCT